MSWWVYVLISDRNQRTYVGIAQDPERRLQQHNGEQSGGARATRGHRPWRIGKRWGPYVNRGTAQRIESRIKKRRGLARLDWEETEGS
jgi:predicted GIY-YIG superfamily endonuclease